ncbi:MAG: hypothetical protein U0J70_03050, partial [Atopobiaceae bacterium]|nr:hypothetical protein [Atopobiaceae bacterium]
RARLIHGLRRGGVRLSLWLGNGEYLFATGMQKWIRLDGADDELGLAEARALQTSERAQKLGGFLIQKLLRF